MKVSFAFGQGLLAAQSFGNVQADARKVFLSGDGDGAGGEVHGNGGAVFFLEVGPGISETLGDRIPKAPGHLALAGFVPDIPVHQVFSPELFVAVARHGGVAAVPSDELSLRRVEVQDAGHTVEDGLQKVLFFGQGVSGALFFGDVPGDAFDPDDLAVGIPQGKGAGDVPAPGTFGVADAVRQVHLVLPPFQQVPQGILARGEVFRMNEGCEGAPQDRFHRMSQQGGPCGGNKGEEACGGEGVDHVVTVLDEVTVLLLALHQRLTLGGFALPGSDEFEGHAHGGQKHGVP